MLLGHHKILKTDKTNLIEIHYFDMILDDKITNAGAVRLPSPLLIRWQEQKVMGLSPREIRSSVIPIGLPTNKQILISVLFKSRVDIKS